MAQAMQKRLQRLREQEGETQGLQKFLQQQLKCDEFDNSTKRAEARRRVKDIEECNREVETEEFLVRRACEAKAREEVENSEGSIALELERQNGELVREGNRRRQIFEGSESLKTLRNKLMQARVTKERAVQMLEHHFKAEEDSIRESLMDEQMEEMRLSSLEAEKWRDAVQEEQRRATKEHQEDQMRNRQLLQAIALEEYLLEKKQVEDVVERIRQDDVAGRELRLNKQKELRDGYLKDREDRNEYQRHLKQLEDLEERKIEEYNRTKLTQEMDRESVKKKREQERQELVSELVRKQEDKEEQRMQLAQLHYDLWTGELEEAERKEEEEAQKKRQENRLILRRAYQEQFKEKAAKRKEEEEEEAAFREEMMEKFARDDRIEQMNAVKRRMKVLQHKREVEMMVRDRRRQFEEAREREMLEHEKLLREEEEKEEMIEAERQRLLRENANELRNFLPKGTLAKPEDLRLLEPSTRGT